MEDSAVPRDPRSLAGVSTAPTARVASTTSVACGQTGRWLRSRRQIATGADPASVTYSAHDLHRSGDDGPERRGRNGRVPRRVRIFRSGRVPGAAVPADQLRRASARCCAAVADFFDGADLIVTYNGKTFDVPGDGNALAVPPDADAARRRAALRHAASGAAAVADARAAPPGDVEGGCRLATLERALFDVTRVGDVPGLEIPGALLQVPAQRRSAPARAGARAQPARSRLAGGGDGAGPCSSRATARRACRDAPKRWRSAGCTSAPGRTIGPSARPPRARRRVLRASGGSRTPTSEGKRSTGWGCGTGATPLRGGRGDAGGEVHRVDRAAWRPADERARGARASLPPRRSRSTTSTASGTSRARGSSRSSLLEEAAGRRADGVRHRLARLDRKIAKKTDAQLLWS